MKASPGAPSTKASRSEPVLPATAHMNSWRNELANGKRVPASRAFNASAVIAPESGPLM